MQATSNAWLKSLVELYFRKFAIRPALKPKNIKLLNPSLQSLTLTKIDLAFQKKQIDTEPYATITDTQRDVSQEGEIKYQQDPKLLLQVLGIRNWQKQQKISHAVFVLKLKQIIQFENKPHLQKLFSWMEHYIKKIYPTSQLTKNQIKDFHCSIKSHFNSLDSMVSKLKETIKNTQWSLKFNQQVQSFELLYPEYQAILQFYSVNEFSPNYTNNYLIARKFFSRLKQQKKQDQEGKKQTKLLSRFQYLTYAAFLEIHQENIHQIKKADIEFLADYSFDEKVSETWTFHIYYANRYSSWTYIKNYLMFQWKLINQDIVRQKEKMLAFFETKRIQDELKLNFQGLTPFQKFLTEKQMIDMKKSCHITTENCELVSKPLKCIVFDRKKNDNDNDKQLKQKISKQYLIYMVAQFSLSPQQQTELISLKQKLSSHNVDNILCEKTQKAAKDFTKISTNTEDFFIKMESGLNYGNQNVSTNDEKIIKFEEEELRQEVFAVKPNDNFQMRHYQSQLLVHFMNQQLDKMGFSDKSIQNVSQKYARLSQMLNWSFDDPVTLNRLQKFYRQNQINEFIEQEKPIKQQNQDFEGHDFIEQEKPIKPQNQDFRSNFEGQGSDQNSEQSGHFTPSQPRIEFDPSSQAIQRISYVTSSQQQSYPGSLSQATSQLSRIILSQQQLYLDPPSYVSQLNPSQQLSYFSRFSYESEVNQFSDPQNYPLLGLYQANQHLCREIVDFKTQKGQFLIKQQQNLQQNQQIHQQLNANKILEEKNPVKSQLVFENKQIDVFLSNIISEEQSNFFKQLFHRKTFEYFMIRSFQHKQINPAGKQKSQYWRFHENVRFVSFLIINKFVFTTEKQLQQNTHHVMSQFILTKDPQECKSHYYSYRTQYGKVDSIIKNTIKSVEISADVLKTQVERQKLQYLQSKSDFLFLANIPEFRKSKSIHKTISQFFVERFNKKPITFNIKFSSLFNDEDQEFVNKITQIQRQRYLNCLEKIHQKKSSRVTEKCLNQYAHEIFKERDVEQQIAFLQKYHQIMKSKYRDAKSMLLKEKRKEEKIRKKKKKMETIKQQNFKLLDNLCNRMYQSDGTMVLEMIQYVREVKESD